MLTWRWFATFLLLTSYVAFSAEDGSRTAETGEFVDVSEAVGLSAPLDNSYVHAGSWGDIDSDGWPDLFAGTFVVGPTTVANKLLHNASGEFADAAQPAVELSGRASGGLFIDLDRDGDDDLLVSNNRKANQTGPAGEPSKLFRNDGGVFVDVTASSGLDAQTRRGRQTAAFDYDRDGLLDLFIVADSFGQGGPTVLLRNVGDMQFVDVTAAAGIPDDVHGLGLAVGDLTGDGLADIFVAGGDVLTLPNHNYLFIAEGDGTYRNVIDHGLDWTEHTTGSEDWVSSGAMGDLNRDGRLDLLVGHHFGSASDHGPGAPLRVYLNRGNRPNGVPILEDVTDDLGLPRIDSKAPHVEIADFNNDGWPDLYTSVTVAGQPLIFLHEGLTDGAPTFTIPSVVDPHYYPVGPTADFDRDGRLDMFLGEFRSVLQGTPDDVGVVPSLLLRNEMAAGNWLDVTVASPTEGIGATVALYEAGSVDEPSALLGYSEIQVGNGFSSTSLPVAHFGVGAESSVDVVVTLPQDGRRLVRQGVVVNQRLNLMAAPPSTVRWPLDEGAGSIAGDVSGNGNHGEIIGNPRWANGVSGAALTFRERGDRIVMPATVLDGASDLTVSMWIKPKPRRTQTLMSGANDAKHSAYDIRLVQRRKIVVQAAARRATWTFPSLADGKWHHVAVVRDGDASAITLYVDGVSLGSQPTAPKQLVITEAALGADQKPAGVFLPVRSWRGGLDEILLFTEALTDEQIADLAGSGG